MKKRDFLLTGALLAAFSLNAQETMFFYGFEDGGQDSIPVDSITQAVAYDEAIGARDTLIYLYSPNYNISNEGDVYEIVKDPDGVIDPVTGFGGEYYLKVQTGTVEDSPTYQRVVKIRNIPVLDETSYRLTYYMKAGGNAHTFTSMQRGIDYCDKNFVTASNTQFTYDQSDYNPEKWIRRTSMYYYINDSVQEKHCSDNFWWASTWEAWGGKIYQPDKYLAAISMYTKGQTYMLDNISLVRSSIGGAEYNGDVIRVDFGYETNLSDIAAAATFKAVAIDNTLVTVTGGENTEAEFGSTEIEVLNVEYHLDGFMYIWVAANIGELVDDGDTIKVSFTNPKNDDDLALKYTSSLRPHTLDTTWEKTKFVDDFSGEIALFNDIITATPIWLLAPSFVSSVPDAGSFNLNSSEVNQFTVNFNKEVYQHATNGVVAYLQKVGFEEQLTIASYANEGSTLVFARSATTALSGDYTLLIRNVKADAEGDPAPEIKIALTFGEAASAPPVIYVTNHFAKLAGRIEAGWNVEADNETRIGDAFINAEDEAEGTSYSSGCRLMKFGASSEMKGGMYLAARGASNGYLRFGDGDSLFTLEAGDYWVNYALAGWDGAKPSVTFKMYKKGDSENPILTEVTTPRVNNATSGANLAGVNKIKLSVNIATAGSYVLEWSVSDGFNGAAIGDVEVTNVYSNAYVYIKMFNDAFAAAQSLQATAQAENKYSGADLDQFNTLVTNYTGWSHTSPAEYTLVSDEIKAATATMQVRITNVDAFYTKFNVIYNLDTTYQAPHDYSGLVAYKSLQDSVAKYNDYEIPTVNSADLVAINTNLDATAKVLNDRISAISQFNTNCSNAVNLFDQYASTPYAEFDAYKTLQTAYNDNYQTDVITATDEDLAASSKAIGDSYTAANGLIGSVSLLTAQINKLIELNEQLGVDWDATSTVMTKAELDARLAITLTDDQAFANILKLAAKKAIYENIALNSDADSLDMTGFIQNSALYTQSQLRAKLPAVSDAFTGWNLEYSAGNAYTGTAYGYSVASEATPVVNSFLGMDWNTALTLDQAIVNLPAGVYTLGIGFGSGKVKDGTKLYASQYDEEGDSVLVVSTPMVTGGATWSGPSTNIYLEDFEAFGDTINVGFQIVATDDWSFADNFTLNMVGKLEGCDYDAAAAQAGTDLDNFISRIETVSGETSVQYFNLNGVEISSPQVGINIKVTVNADGSRKIEKILVK